MKLLKLPVIIFSVLLSVFIIFYLWAKGPKSSPTEYTTITQYREAQFALPDTFLVMTYNLGYASGMTNNLPVERPKSMIEQNLKHADKLLGEIKPQIIGFQEIDFNSSRSYHMNQMEHIAKESDFAQAAAAVNWDKRYVPFPYWPLKYNFGDMLSGQAILSQIGVVSNSRIVLPFPDNNPFYYDSFYLDRLAQITWLKNGEDSLLVINVHFEAWDASTREKQADIVLDLFKKYELKYPIFLIGDFNCSPPFDENAMKELTISKLISHPAISLAINESKYKSSPSHFFTFDSQNPNIKIDYIMYNNRFLQCIDAQVVNRAGSISDHLPVLARFVFAN